MPMLSRHAVAVQLSRVGHPFVLFPVLVTAAAFRSLPPARAALVAGVIIAAAILPVVLLTHRRVAQGRWSDHDVSDPRQRLGFYRGAIAVSLLATGALWLAPVPGILFRGSLGTLLLVVAARLIHPHSKISLHAISGAYVGVTLFQLVGPAAGIGMLLFVVLVCWSRLVLGRHTLPQVVTGAALGSLAGLLLVARP